MQPTNVGHPDYYHRVVDCQWACPAHTNVPEYIRLIAQGRFTEAYMVNRQSNVFPGILGRTCDRPCEPACRRGRVEAEPVAREAETVGDLASAQQAAHLVQREAGLELNRLRGQLLWRRPRRSRGPS